MKKLIYFLVFVIILKFTLNFNYCEAQWIPTNPPTEEVYCFASSGTNLFAGVPGRGVLLSTDYGQSWSEVHSGLTNSYIADLQFSGNNLFAATNGGIFLSSNFGANWTSINNGLTTSIISVVVVNGSQIFAGTGNGKIFQTTNNGANWNLQSSAWNSNTYVTGFVISGSTFFAGTFKNFLEGGVYISTNNGVNWVAVNNGLLDSAVLVLNASGSNLYAGTSGNGHGGLYLSTNNGAIWISINNNGLPNTACYAFTSYGSNIFAGDYYNGVFQSSNNGLNWSNISIGLPISVYSNVLTVFGQFLFLGTVANSENIWRRPLFEIISVIWDLFLQNSDR